MIKEIEYDTNLVVGAGFTGATIAKLVSENLNEKVLVIDKRNHLAGNCYDYKDENNITIHKYGSHIFHTNDQNVWDFVSRFADFNTYMHKVIAVIDGIETTIPFNFNTLYDVFPKSLATRLEKKLLDCFEYNKKIPILKFQEQEDDDLKFLAEYIYEKIFLNYTQKQWGVDPKNICKSVTSRVPVFLSKDNRYFQDKYQGIPLKGYTDLINNMLKDKNINVSLNTEYKDIKDKKYKRIFYTGSIDEFFGYKYGKLPYRSVKFKIETVDQEYYQVNSVVNYPCNYDFTRIHEYKYYLNEKSNKTVIAKEYSEEFELGKNERYYPIIKDENILLHNKYIEEAKKLDDVYFLGRLGDYKYYDMDKSILRAIELFNKEVIKK